MMYLSESALKYAVNVCKEFPGYKVGIATSVLPVLVALKIFSITMDKDTAEVVENEERNCATIEFSNNSIIQIVSTSDTIRDYTFNRAYTFNLLIVEYGIYKLCFATI